MHDVIKTHDSVDRALDFSHASIFDTLPQTASLITSARQPHEMSGGSVMGIGK